MNDRELVNRCVDKRSQEGDRERADLRHDIAESIQRARGRICTTTATPGASSDILLAAYHTGQARGHLNQREHGLPLREWMSVSDTLDCLWIRLARKWHTLNIGPRPPYGTSRRCARCGVFREDVPPGDRQICGDCADDLREQGKAEAAIAEHDAEALWHADQATRDEARQIALPSRTRNS